MTGTSKGGARIAVAVVLLALLSACAETSQRTASNGPFYNRPDSASPPGPPGDPWGPWIRDAARRFDIPELWIREVMRQESGGRANATSHAGAMGLMQVMPGTYRELRSRYNLGPDPYHPYDSIQAGAAYLREMYELYGNPAFLAAYNAGPRRVEEYLWGGRGLPNETRNYVARIGPRITTAQPARRAAPEVYAAAEMGFHVPPGPRPSGGASMLALRDQRMAAPPVQMAAAPPPPPAAPRVQVASLAAPPLAAAPGLPAHMQGLENPTLTPSARAALAEAARQSEVERAAQQAEEAAAARVATAALQPPERRAPAAAPFRGLGFVGTAQAATPARAMPTPPRPTTQAATGGTDWAVQVGAFASENLARTTANQARDAVATMGTRTVITPVRQGNTTLYRARVTGLSRPAAEQACSRLRARGACSVVAPGA